MKGSGNQSLHWEVDNDSTTLMNQYDPAGNIARRNTEDGPWQYGYDKLNRLTKVTPPEAITSGNTLPEEQYTYDAVGNRTASLHQPGAWQYNQDNQLLQWGTDSDLTALTWTAAGQTHTQNYAGQTRTHHYDATQRLIQVKDDNANLASYRYDPLGRRISKTVNGQTTWYLYSGEGMVAELDQQGRITKGYGYTPDTSYGTAPLWQAEAQSTNQLSTATLHYLHTDHLGTPQMATDKQGNQTWKGHSEAFGKTTPDSSSLITMNLRFPGQYLDGETNTHYNWFRDYSPSIGRYIQVDPIGLDGGENLYGYANNNSLMVIDNTGRIGNSVPPVPPGRTPPSEHAPAPLPDNEMPDYTACDYYDEICKESGCKYHCNAGAICRGGNRAVNFVVFICGVTAKEMNCIRKCLVRVDKLAQEFDECQLSPKNKCSEGHCTKRSCINFYHQTCYRDCNVNGDRFPFGYPAFAGNQNGCYGGNWEPWGVGGVFWDNDGD